jgi:hypothetical protein
MDHGEAYRQGLEVWREIRILHPFSLVVNLLVVEDQASCHD